MSVLVWLVPLAMTMGGAGLLAFLWSLKNGQYEDLSGAAARILLEEEVDRPLSDVEAGQTVEFRPACNGRQTVEVTTDRMSRVLRMKR